jgi:hypothetical protein
MKVEIKLLGLGRHWNDFGELARLDATVEFGSKKATISLYPEGPLASPSEEERFVRRQIQELAESILRIPSSRKAST